MGQWKMGGAMRTKEEIADKDFKKEFTDGNSRNQVNVEKRKERKYGMVKGPSTRKRSPSPVRQHQQRDTHRDRRHQSPPPRRQRSRERERRRSRSRDRKRSRSRDRKR